MRSWMLPSGVSARRRKWWRERDKGGTRAPRIACRALNASALGVCVCVCVCVRACVRAWPCDVRRSVLLSQFIEKTSSSRRWTTEPCVEDIASDSNGPRCTPRCCVLILDTTDRRFENRTKPHRQESRAEDCERSRVLEGENRNRKWRRCRWCTAWIHSKG